MARPQLLFENVSFAYETNADWILEQLSFHLEAGWTGVVGPNGAGKTTLLQLADGTLEPSRGTVTLPSHSIYCSQRTDHPPHQLGCFLTDPTRPAAILREQLKLATDFGRRWGSLSHGERKRAQIGVALWEDPQLLLLDEPTNHIDEEGRTMLFAALGEFKHIGLLVCHDRHWLDELCRQCLFCESPNVILRPGNYSEGVRQARRIIESADRRSALAKQELKRLRREMGRRAETAAGADRKRSKRKLRRGDADGRDKINRARVTGKDGQAGRLLSQLEGRMNRAQQTAAQNKTTKTHTQGIWLPGEVSRSDALIRLPKGSIALGPGRRLALPDLIVRPTDRLAITGSNGAGKSRLFNHLLDNLQLADDRCVVLPQEIDTVQSERILATARELPSVQLGQVLTVVRRLGSDPKRILTSAIPSPGETRKLLLAIGIARQPHLIAMDEPTNHLDLQSIECLEEALADCPSAIILISHDEQFLNRLTNTRWTCRQDRLVIN